MTTSGFQSLPQHAAGFTSISQWLLISRFSARCYAEGKSLFTLSNSFDDRGVPVRILAALSLAFPYCEFSFFSALYNASAISGLPWLPNVQIGHTKPLTHSRSPLLKRYRHWWVRHKKLMAKTAFFEALLQFCTTNKIFVCSIHLTRHIKDGGNVQTTKTSYWVTWEDERLKIEL